MSRIKNIHEPVKSLGVTEQGDLRIGGYIVLFGGKDLSGEYFTANTDFESEYTKTGTLYLDFEHGYQPDKIGPARDDVLGLVEMQTAKSDERGLFVEMVLKRQSQYFDWIAELVEIGALGTSSEADPRGVLVGADGEIIRWPLRRHSLTATPMEPKMLNDDVRIAAIKAIADKYPAAKFALGALLKNSAGASDSDNNDNDKNCGIAATKPTEKSIMFTKEQIAQINQMLTAGKSVSEIITAGGLGDDATEFVETLKSTFHQPVNDIGYAKNEPKSVAQNTGMADVVSAFDDYVASGERKPYIDTAKAYKSTPEYQSNFEKSVRGSGKAATDPVQIGSAVDGGYWVPGSRLNEINAPLAQASIFRSLRGARVLTVNDGKSLDVPGWDKTTNDSTVIAENGTYPVRNPKATNLTFSPYKQGFISKESDEALRAQTFDIFGQIMAPNAAQDFADGENTLFTTGNGSSKPSGILTGGTTGKITASASAITAAELLAFSRTLPQVLRQAGYSVMMMHENTAAAIDALVDGSSRPLWRNGLTGEMDTLLGYPVVINNNMPTIAAGAKVIALFDPRYFWITDFWSGSVELLRMNELYATTGHIGFRWTRWYDSKIVMATAVQYLRML